MCTKTTKPQKQQQEDPAFRNLTEAIKTAGKIIHKRIKNTSSIAQETFQAIKNVVQTIFKVEFKITSDELKSAVNAIVLQVDKNLTVKAVQSIPSNHEINQNNHTANDIGNAITVITKTASKIPRKDVLKNNAHMMISAIKTAAKEIKLHLQNALTQKTTAEEAKKLHAAENNFANTLADEIEREIAPSSSTSQQLSHTSTSSATYTTSNTSNSTNSHVM